VANEGRPPLYDDPVAMQKRIDEYFRYCDNRTADKTDDDGKTVTYPNPEAYTMAGLCHWLGFDDRQRLEEYQKKKAFTVIVKRARMKVQSFWEGRLADRAPVGSIFWLKNHAGYRDQTEHNVTGSFSLTMTQREAKMIGLPLPKQAADAPRK